MRAAIEDVLSDPAIEAVFIASETSEHANLIEAAAAAGKTIIVQKPLAFRLDDCARIQRPRGGGHPFTVAYQMRHDPANQKMRELVQGGEIGQVGSSAAGTASACSSARVHNPETQWHVKCRDELPACSWMTRHAADFPSTGCSACPCP